MADSVHISNVDSVGGILLQRIGEVEYNDTENVLTITGWSKKEDILYGLNGRTVTVSTDAEIPDTEYEVTKATTKSHPNVSADNAHMRPAKRPFLIELEPNQDAPQPVAA